MKFKLNNPTKNCEKNYILIVKDTLNYHITLFNNLHKENNNSLRIEEFYFSESKEKDK